MEDGMDIVPHQCFLGEKLEKHWKNGPSWALLPENQSRTGLLREIGEGKC